MAAVEETGGSGDRYSRLIGELCTLHDAIISSGPASASASSSRMQQQREVEVRRPRGGGMSAAAAAAASMLLGASVALMLCGSVTFAIGFLLMPWVAGLALLFCLAGAVSTLSSGFFGKPGLLPCQDATCPAKSDPLPGHLYSG